ncbi:MAG: SGNH/GDSL hydrolase family protein [Phycisphaerales bacterium]|nr:SGNH/GDSL hydrolase family protein [Phycisphaerales bacterium]
MKIPFRLPTTTCVLLVVVMLSAVLGIHANSFAVATTWTDADMLLVEGRAFEDRKSPWDRFPARAEGVVRAPVWGNSRHSAGIAIRFLSDSPSIDVRWRLTSERLEMPHMPATGVSGVDLYVRTDLPGNSGWRWVGNGRPSAVENQKRLASGLDRVVREWMVYLPLYNGVESIEIGTADDASIAPAEKRDRPIVFYGTSITHGASASRPGMAHVAILGRRLDVPVVNLGFSGSGTLDLEVAELMSEIDASVYVLDCLPNLRGEQVAARAAPFVRRLRSLRPGVPIILVEDRTYADALFNSGKATRNRENRAALKAARDVLVAEGVDRLFYIEGNALLGADGEATVDSSHPTDLGFMRHADVFEPVLRSAMAANEAPANSIEEIAR